MVDSQFAATANATTVTTLIKTVDAPVLANTNEVETGSKVNGIYLHIEANATSSAALANLYMAVMKNPGANLANIPPNVQGSNDNKKYVIHSEMIMFQQVTNSNPRTLFNGVIVIPRGYIRNGPADELRLIIIAPGVNINVCIQCHYKEFR